MYEITYHPRVRKQLKKIPAKDSSNIQKIIKNLSKNPFDGHAFNLRKVEDDPLAIRCKVGQYRIVYVVYKNDKVMDIRRVQHRQWNYKKIYTFFQL